MTCSNPDRPDCHPERRTTQPSSRTRIRRRPRRRQGDPEPAWAWPYSLLLLALLGALAVWWIHQGPTP